MMQRPRRQLQRPFHATGTPPDSPAQNLAARNLVLRAQTHPASKMLPRRPTAHVRTDLTDQNQRCRLVNSLDRCQVHAAQPIQPGPRIKARLVGLPLAPPRPVGQRLALAPVRKRPEMRLNSPIASADLL